MAAMDIILASASPRRKELLSTLGLTFRVITAPEFDEAQVLQASNGALPERLQHLSYLKGVAVSKEHQDAIVLSADTVVVLDDEVLGKPKDAADASRMLTLLSGRQHSVYTAIYLQRAVDKLALGGVEQTLVTFHELDEAIIDSYIRRAEPYDKAGSYAIQGLGAVLVAGIRGDYSNVVGLPLGMTARLLAKAGIDVL